MQRCQETLSINWLAKGAVLMLSWLCCSQPASLSWLCCSLFRLKILKGSRSALFSTFGLIELISAALRGCRGRIVAHHHHLFVKLFSL
jgi:hypothetical protein